MGCDITDKIIIAIPKYVEPGTYEYKTIVYKETSGRILIETGTLISKSSAVATDPAVGGQRGGIAFGLIFVSFYLVTCGIGLLFLIRMGGRT